MARKPSEAQLAAWEALLLRHLEFYKALHEGRRPARTPAQMNFVEVTSGLREAQTLHEKAYLQHLRMEGAPVRCEYFALPRRLKSDPKNAQENMARWRPWHD
ncbi:hypothetical protein ACWPM1_13505 [Tsuneonella sp. HG249]